MKIRHALKRFELKGKMLRWEVLTSYEMELAEPPQLQQAAVVKISQREHQVLGLVKTDSQNKEIAAALNISVRTAKFHVSSLLQKYGVATRGELATLLRQVAREEE